VYNIRQIGPDTKVFGIIGNPVGHSKSPILHNEAFRSVGLNAVYVPFLVDDLAKFLHTYSSPDFAGFRYLIVQSQANCYAAFFVYAIICTISRHVTRH
jgi:3-dehydroquinate dehydratase/shikimate dehydrogenase